MSADIYFTKTNLESPASIGCARWLDVLDKVKREWGPAEIPYHQLFNFDQLRVNNGGTYAIVYSIKYSVLCFNVINEIRFINDVEFDRMIDSIRQNRMLMPNEVFELSSKLLTIHIKS